MLHLQFRISSELSIIDHTYSTIQLNPATNTTHSNMPNPTNDPNWPNGYPCIATEDHSSSRPKTVNIRKGDLGRVISYDRNNDQCFIVIESRDNKPQGWVSKKYLQIGKVKCVHHVRDLTMETNLPRPNQATQDVPCTPGNFAATDYFKKAATAMFSAYIQQGSSALKDMVPVWLIQLTPNTLNQHVLTPIFNGVASSNIAAVISNPNFTLDEITTKATLVTPQNHRGGIYLIKLSKFKDNRPPEIYIGQTHDFSDRFRLHRSSSKTKNQAVYRAWRESQEQKMYVLCNIDGDGQQQRRQRTAAEQLFICLFETYHPCVLDPTKLLTSADADQTVEDADTSLEAAQQLYHHKRHAALLQYFERCTRSKSGWKGAISRQQGFGAAKGLNWSSPLAEVVNMSDKVLWLKTTYPDMEVYRRSPLKVNKHPSSGYLICCRIQKHHYKAGGGKRDHTDALEVFFPKGFTEPAEGTEVQTIIEIMNNGQCHPVPFARLAGVGPWPDWDQANRIGIKVEWRDEHGAWKHKYCQHTYGGDRSDLKGVRTESPGEVRAYGKALGLLHYFKREVWPMVAWPESFGTAEVKEVKYDHLEQKIKIVDTPKTNRSIAPPHKLSVQTMAQQLQAASNYPNLGPTKIGGTFGVFPNGAQPRNPATCDACHLANIKPIRCKEKSNAGGACEICYRLGLPCTWTDDLTLRHKDRLKKALKAPGKDDRAINTVGIDDPNLVLVGGDDDGNQ